MAPIVREVCADYGIKYIVRKNLWTAIGGHIGLLRFLSSGEAAFGHMIDDPLTAKELERANKNRDIRNGKPENEGAKSLDMKSGKVDTITSGWGLYGFVAMVGLWRYVSD
jgi:hypothetical protein